MTRGVLDVRLVAKALLAPLPVVREFAVPLVDVSIPMAGFSPFAVLSSATPDGSATRGEGNRKRADSPGMVRMGMEPARTGAAAPVNKAAAPRAEVEADRTAVESPPVFSFRSRTAADRPRANGKTTGTSVFPVASVSDLLRAAIVEAAGSAVHGSPGLLAAAAESSGNNYSPIENAKADPGEPPSASAGATGSTLVTAVSPASAAIQAIADLAQELLSAAPLPSAAGGLLQTDAAPSAEGLPSQPASFSGASGSNGVAAGRPLIESLERPAFAYPEALRSETTEPRATVQPAAPGTAANLSSSDLADMVNEALVEQARRHGVDLS